jgi:rod shape-determining protein MreC
MPSNADVEPGDVLTTSGVDGVYPPGMPVAKVLRVERRADSAFARIYCEPMAKVQQARHVIVLTPLNLLAVEEPPPPAAPVAAAKAPAAAAKAPVRPAEKTSKPAAAPAASPRKESPR